MADGAGAATLSLSLFAHVLLTLATITLLARFVGGLFRRLLHQPPVIGEILAGLMLGPSFLGTVAPRLYAFLLPAAAVPQLNVIASLGVVLFMFLVGLDLDLGHLTRSSRTVFAVGNGSIAVPFALGAGLGALIFPIYGTPGVGRGVFSLFFGVTLSVTAFPVLARILVDRGVHKTALGVTALSCAAAADITAWLLLALVAGIARAQISGVAITALLLLAYVALMLILVKPLVSGLVEREQRKEGALSRTTLAAVFGALLLSSFATDAIGVHALFGAFLLGAILPHEGRLAEQIRARLEDAVIVLLLPAFFVLTGMRTQVGLISERRDIAVCLVIVLVAVAGKVAGSFVAARGSGVAPRSALALGILMNSRGLMELVVLNIGLDMGLISPAIFTMLVVMALVTTLMTTPLLDLCVGPASFGPGDG